MNFVFDKVIMTTKQGKTLYLTITNSVCYLLFEEMQGKISIASGVSLEIPLLSVNKST